ncbi:DUF6907 domain-containing protein [Nonomuraea sp. NPDC050383]|uniref:DUF6907 domain-containing protein n=1 Tax=Nonomuraea sp. NPDC050383 TaxID=3364362 RepID=UPI0037BD58CD
MTQLTIAPAGPIAVPAFRLLAWVCAICRMAGLPAVFVDVKDGQPVYACSGCGRRDVPPAHTAPAAATAGCPPWCMTDHSNGVDVEHEGAMRDLAESSIAQGDRFGDVVAQLRQEPGEAARVALAVCTDRGDQEAEISLEEALQVAYGLINAVSAARAASR